MRRKKKQRLIQDVDSTEDPAHGKQENVAFNGLFGKNCYHQLFAFTSNGDCLGAKLRPGNVHSADGVVAFLRRNIHFLVYPPNNPGIGVLVSNSRYRQNHDWQRRPSLPTHCRGSASLPNRVFERLAPACSAARGRRLRRARRYLPVEPRFHASPHFSGYSGWYKSRNNINHQP